MSHRTFRNKDDAKKRLEQLKKQKGKNYEFTFKMWGSNKYR